MIAELWTLTAAIGVFAAGRNVVDAALAWNDTYRSGNGLREALLLLWGRTVVVQSCLFLVELGLFGVGAIAVLIHAPGRGPLSVPVFILFGSAWLLAVTIVLGRIFNDRLDRIIRKHG